MDPCFEPDSLWPVPGSQFVLPSSQPVKTVTLSQSHNVTTVTVTVQCHSKHGSTWPCRNCAFVRQIGSNVLCNTMLACAAVCDASRTPVSILYYGDCAFFGANSALKLRRNRHLSVPLTPSCCCRSGSVPVACAEICCHCARVCSASSPRFTHGCCYCDTLYAICLLSYQWTFHISVLRHGG